MRAILIGAVFVLILASVAFGHEGNDPIAGWYRDLQNWNPGAIVHVCCNDTDCRNTEYRIVGDHYEALISKAAYGPDAPDAWLPVPAEALLKSANPTGDAVACWYEQHIVCFVPPDQV